MPRIGDTTRRLRDMAAQIERLAREIDELDRADRAKGRDSRRIAVAVDALMKASHELHRIGLDPEEQ